MMERCENHIDLLRNVLRFWDVSIFAWCRGRYLCPWHSVLSGIGGEKLRGPTSWQIGNWNRYETGDLKGICLRDAVQDLGCFFGLFLVSYLWDGQESLLRLRIWHVTIGMSSIWVMWAMGPIPWGRLMVLRMGSCQGFKVKLEHTVFPLPKSTYRWRIWRFIMNMN